MKEERKFAGGGIKHNAHTRARTLSDERLSQSYKLTLMATETL